ncbi:MAG TPA: class I tRNA ligase family protein, partial [Bacilli bacterium]|nr:class I tRNA ligase family protein [Bacilli bacterium]
WYPAWGETRMINMIKDRSDWCISRQRAWGVPIPIFYNEDGSPIIEEKVFAHVQALIAEHGSNIWYEKEAKELLPEGYTNIHSPHGAFTKEKDIMDVWFDSGSSFASVLINRGQKYPADLYFEGSDQYRGWFNSSLIISTAVYGYAPYKTVSTHGWVMDEKWEKMSKSKGNGIDPSKIADLYGADILRLWTAIVDYHQDVRISESIIKQVSEQYRKIRNVLKFISWNLADFDSKDKVDTFRPVDQYILAKLDEVVEQVSGYFETYDFSNALSVILTFISSDLSAFYLDISKDSLYCDGKDMLTRRQTQTVISEIGETMLRLLNPILPFTMDEFNANLPGERVKNVQLLDYPKAKKEAKRAEILKEYQLFQTLRDDVLKALEVARNEQIIGSSQEAKVEICLSEGGRNYLSLFKGLDKLSIAKLFIVSGLDFVDSLEGGAAYPCGLIKVSHHQGHFCQRCWNYEDDGLVQEDGTYLCHRCQEVIHK